MGVLFSLFSFLFVLHLFNTDFTLTEWPHKNDAHVVVFFLYFLFYSFYIFFYGDLPSTDADWPQKNG